jgi:hypothetical protein
VLPAGACAGDPFTVVSVCARQGDDLIGVLAGNPSAAHVKGRLVELDARNVAQLRARVDAAGLDGLEIVHGDAADTALYADVLPADLVLLCGVLGYISDADVMRTVAAMPQFCNRGATVIWTRSRREPDLTPAVRSSFATAGFTETAWAPATSCSAWVHAASTGSHNPFKRNDSSVSSADCGGGRGHRRLDHGHVEDAFGRLR